jgi:hypothetical protein
MAWSETVRSPAADLAVGGGIDVIDRPPAQRGR